MSLSVKELQHALYHDLRLKGVKYFILNSYCFRYEADFLGITKANYVTEYEIKRSKTDYLSEFVHKKQKHDLIEKGKLIPNYFYFVCEKDLIKKDEVPIYAGLIYIEKYLWKSKVNYSVNTIKIAPKLHSNKLSDFNLLKALRSMMFKILENLLK